MKKPTRSSANDKRADPKRRGFELASQDDDDIIDLEDIIEMPDRPIDEDEDLDLGILDVSSDFESKTKQPVQAPKSEEEDLIGVFDDEVEDAQALFDKIASEEKAKEKRGTAETKIFGDEEESILDELMDETRIPEPTTDDEKDLDLMDEASMMELMMKEAPPVKPQPEVKPQPKVEAQPEVKPQPNVEAQPEPPSPEPLDIEELIVPPAVDPSKTADELIGRIESHLQEYIRALVESSLPDLVRSIISEEIEKLKQELK